MNQNPYHQFLHLVFEMRKAQKDYFKLRTQSALIKSKEIEKKVDNWIKECGFQEQSLESKPTQMVLGVSTETGGDQ